MYIFCHVVCICVYLFWRYMLYVCIVFMHLHRCLITKVCQNSLKFLSLTFWVMSEFLVFKKMFTPIRILVLSLYILRKRIKYWKHLPQHVILFTPIGKLVLSLYILRKRIKYLRNLPPRVYARMHVLQHCSHATSFGRFWLLKYVEFGGI